MQAVVCPSRSFPRGGCPGAVAPQRRFLGGPAPGAAGSRGAAAVRRQQRAAAAAQQSGDVAAAGLSVEDLRKGLEEAVKAEDYATAARIRDRITALEKEDPVLRAERELTQAIAEERFEDAAKLRDRLKELRPPPPPPEPVPAAPPRPRAPVQLGPYDPTSPTTSDTVTDGVRVTCRSFYVPAESYPASGRYFFGYQISIRNESQQTVKLMERYWHITNGQGQSQEVRGPGVVGEQPELAPGESFSYQSACPLPTPQGTMEGHYEFYALDDASGQWRKSFLVKIGQFTLRAD